jgi:hypothetical protein
MAVSTVVERAKKALESQRAQEDYFWPRILVTDLVAELNATQRLLDELTDSDVGEAMAHNNELMHERNDLLRRNEALQAEVRRLGGGML